MGQLIDEKGNKYNFSKKFIFNKKKDLNKTKGSKVSFYPMKGSYRKKSAEHIKIIEERKKLNEPKRLEKIKTPIKLPIEIISKEFEGTIASIVEFGVFVSIIGQKNGLLHSNNMPLELKSIFK